MLVLDCLVPHDFNNKTADLMNLQHYVIKEKKLTEKEAIVIFFDIVRIVQSLHNVCIIVLCKHTKSYVPNLIFYFIISKIFMKCLCTRAFTIHFQLFTR